MGINECRGHVFLKKIDGAGQLLEGDLGIDLRSIFQIRARRSEILRELFFAGDDGAQAIVRRCKIAAHNHINAVGGAGRVGVRIFSQVRIAWSDSSSLRMALSSISRSAVSIWLRPFGSRATVRASNFLRPAMCLSMPLRDKSSSLASKSCTPICVASVGLFGKSSWSRKSSTSEFQTLDGVEVCTKAGRAKGIRQRTTKNVLQRQRSISTSRKVYLEYTPGPTTEKHSYKMYCNADGRIRS